MGGFRFKTEPNGEFINSEESLRIQPITDIRTLVQASTEIERSEENNQLPEKNGFSNWYILVPHWVVLVQKQVW